ncbi:MAG: hypothetical protein ACPLZY_04735, partial [Candidatus Norongarragalinales archaeon]
VHRRMGKEIKLEEIDYFLQNIRQLEEEVEDETVVYAKPKITEEMECVEITDLRDSNGGVIATLCRIY